MAPKTPGKETSPLIEVPFCCSQDGLCFIRNCCFNLGKNQLDHHPTARIPPQTSKLSLKNRVFLAYRFGSTVLPSSTVFPGGWGNAGSTQVWVGSYLYIGGFKYFPAYDIEGAKEAGMMYFPTKWGAKEPQNPQNHRVVFAVGKCSTTWRDDSSWLISTT